MQLPIILVLVATCGFSTSQGLYIRDDVGLRSNIGREGPGFLHRLGDWIRHVKERICEKLFGTVPPTPPPISPDLLNFDNFELKNRKENRNRFLLDLSDLSLDPTQDWGFRIGSWYFIRKVGNGSSPTDNNSDDFNTQPWDSGEMEVLNATEAVGDSVSDAVNDSETPKPSSIVPTTEAPTTHAVTQSMTQSDTQPMTEATTQIDLLDGFLTREEGRIEDNETDNQLTHKGSVEILMR